MSRAVHFCRGMFLGASLVLIYSQVTKSATESLYYTWAFFLGVYAFAAFLNHLVGEDE